MINENLTLFQAVLFIAHYTGFDKNEIWGWTADEISEAIKFINDQKKLDSELYFSRVLSSVDYHIIATREYQKKQGKDIVADKQAIKEAQETMNRIRENLTGVKAQAEVNKNNISVLGFFAGYTPLFTNPKTQ